MVDTKTIQHTPYNRQLIFVYGSLKQHDEDSAGHNSSLLGEDPIFLGKGETLRADFNLAAVWSKTRENTLSPAAIKVEQDGRKLTGELYLVDQGTMRVLDGLEDHPTRYRREEVSCTFQANAANDVLPANTIPIGDGGIMRVDAAIMYIHVDENETRVLNPDQAVIDDEGRYVWSITPPSQDSTLDAKP